MVLAISQWAVGFLIVMISIRVLNVKASGIFALLILTVVPYGIGHFLFELLKISN